MSSIQSNSFTAWPTSSFLESNHSGSLTLSVKSRKQSLWLSTMVFTLLQSSCLFSLTSLRTSSKSVVPFPNLERSFTLSGSVDDVTSLYCWQAIVKPSRTTYKKVFKRTLCEKFYGCQHQWGWPPDVTREASAGDPEVLGALYSEVQCILGNGHMGTPFVNRQTQVKHYLPRTSLKGCND